MKKECIHARHNTDADLKHGFSEPHTSIFMHANKLFFMALSRWKSGHRLDGLEADAFLGVLGKSLLALWQVKQMLVKIYLTPKIQI
jgi:hypothetical protein